MVARARHSAIAFTLLLVGSTLLALVPVAEATHTTGTAPTIYVEAALGSTGFKNATLTTISSGMRVWINVTQLTLGTNPPQGCNSGVPGAGLTANVDLSRFAPQSQTTTSTAPAATSPFDGMVISFVVGQRTGFAPAANDKITMTVTYTCASATGDSSTTPSTSSINEFTLDNSPPHITSVDVGAALKKVGDTFTLTATYGATPGFSNYTIDVSQVNPTTFTAGGLTFTNGIATGTGTPPTSVAGITVMDTGIEDPVVAIGGGDTSGNTVRIASPTGRFDAQRPTLATTTVTPQLNLNVHVGLGAVTGADTPDRWQVNVTPSGGSQTTLTCLTSVTADPGAGSSNRCWFPASPANTLVVRAYGTTLFASNASYTITASPLDNAGNGVAGAWPGGVRTMPSTDAYVATITVPAVMVKPSFPTFSGSVSDWNPNVAMNLSIKNAGGAYWDAATGAFIAPAADGTHYRAMAVTRTGNTWTYSHTPTNAVPPATSAEGTYTINLTVFDGSGKLNWYEFPFILDKTGAVLDGSGTNNTLDETTARWRQGIDVVAVRIGANDTNGIDKIVFRVVRPFTAAVSGGALVPSTATQVTGLDGQPLAVTCDATSLAAPAGGVNGCWLTPPLPTGATSYHYLNTTLRAGALTPPRANLSFAKAPLGQFDLVMDVYDRAGNVKTEFVKTVNSVETSRTPVNVTFGPRVVIPAGNASVDSSRRVTVSAYAAWTNASSLSPEVAACPETTCKVTNVLFQARTAGSSSATALGAAIITAPDQIYTINGLKYYNYSIGAAVGQERTLPAGIDINNAEVNAKITVQLSAGSSVVLDGPWTRLATAATLGALNVVNPAVNGSYAFDPTSGFRDVVFNLTYDEGGLTNAPSVVYRIIRHTDSAAVDSGTVSTPSGRFPATGTPTRYWYNWTNGAGLAEGAYTLHANVTSASGATPFNRTFFVEHSAPVARLNDLTGAPEVDNPDVFAGQYVRSPFNVSYVVDHGNARVSSSGFKLTLGNATQQYLSSTLWSYALTDLYSHDATRSVVNFTVNLPSGLVDGGLVTLGLNVTTDAYHLCKCEQDRMANVTFTRTLSYDGASGFGYVTPVTTAASGANPATELVIHGYAQDNGSGVRQVQVRIFNVTGNSTYSFYGNNFTPGVQDLWLTSDRIPSTAGGDLFYNRAVWIDRTDARAPGQPESRLWRINTTDRPVVDRNNVSNSILPRMPLDRASTYRVDVRVVDNVSRVSGINSTTVVFDAAAPVIQANSFFGPSPNVTDWHVSTPAQKVFRLNVSDNHCVARVSLKGRAPSGAALGPEGFAMPSGAQCGATSATQLHTWVFDLATHPNFTSEIGAHEVWAEVVDPIGNLVNTSPKTLNYSVRDTLPAVVRNITFDPNPAAAGTSTRVKVNVFENHRLDRVEVEMLAANGSVIGSATRASLSGNGTGEYVFETGASSGDVPGLGVTLDTGTYTVRARALDVENAVCAATACPYVSATLTVVAEGAPQVRFDAPATNGSYVNATPTIRFSVIGTGILPANVTVVAGTNASNLSAVNATLTPRTGGGLEGAYAPTGLQPGDNLTVRVTASKSGISTVGDITVKVDATPPVVNVTVTGTTPLNGRNYTTSATKVFINATDDVSAATITYTTSNGVTTSPSASYTSAVTPNPATNDTAWTMSYVVVDSAGNAVRGNVSLAVDKAGPAIAVAKHGDQLLFTVTDAGVGVEGNVTVFYSYGVTGAFESLEAEFLTGNSYQANLPGNASATGLRYYFVARDRLGNTGGFLNHTALTPYVVPKEGETTVPNAAPTIRITSPSPGAVLRDEVNIEWAANDSDGDALTYSIAMRQPREAPIATGLTGVTSYRHPINESEAGVWTIVVTATDGKDSASTTVTFTVPAGEAVRIVNVPPVTAQPGQQVPFSVAIISAGKTVAQANYRVVDADGKAVTAGSLTQSRAGVYSGAARVTAQGEYRVLVDVIYADGSQEPAKDLGAFTVENPSGVRFEKTPVSVGLIAILGLVTIALAAFGAFGRWRK